MLPNIVPCFPCRGRSLANAILLKPTFPSCLTPNPLAAPRPEQTLVLKSSSIRGCQTYSTTTSMRIAAVRGDLLSPLSHARVVKLGSASTTATPSIEALPAKRGQKQIWRVTSTLLTEPSSPPSQHVSAFWQESVHPDDVGATVLVTNTGKYCYNRMPYGVCNAPCFFADIAYKAFGHIRELLC